MAKEERKDIKGENGPSMKFAFGPKNYMFLLIGIACLVIGYITLSGGGSTKPDVFSEDLFSPRRMVLAPIILIIGYGIVAYAIMIRESNDQQ